MKYFFFLLFIYLVPFCFAQDTLYFKAGYHIVGKVFEIGEHFVKYKNSDNLDGPLFVITKNELHHIRYENGVTENFLSNKNIKLTDDFIREIAINDSRKYYRKYSKDSKKVFIFSLFTTPIGGFIAYKKFSKINFTEDDYPKQLNFKRQQTHELISNPYLTNEKYKEVYKTTSLKRHHKKLKQSFIWGSAIPIVSLFSLIGITISMSSLS